MVPEVLEVQESSSGIITQGGVSSNSLHEKEMQDWHPVRRRAARFLDHRFFDAAIGIVISLNVVAMIVETNANAECIQSSCAASTGVDEFFIINMIFLFLYTIETTLRLYVHRFTFWCNFWNLLDFFVVAIGYIDLLSLFQSDTKSSLPDPKTLKIFRMLRMARVLRFIGLFPALQGIVRGFACAMMAMFWGVVTISALLLMFSILAVELVYPYSKDMTFVNPWCQDAFGSVQSALIYFFQTVLVGDSWGECVVPLAQNHHWFVFAFFSIAFVSVQLGLMNLILTAIVDEANYAHECDTEARCREMKQTEMKLIQQLGPIFRSIDADQSGSLSLQELLEAFDTNSRLQKILKLLNIDRLALADLFVLMDADSSGSINYEEFVTTMHDAQVQDSRVQMMKIKLQNSYTAFAVRNLTKDLAKDMSKLVGPSSCMNSKGGSGNEKPNGFDSPPLSDNAAPTALVSTGNLFATIEREISSFRQGLHESIAEVMEPQVRKQTPATPQSDDSCSLDVVRVELIDIADSLGETGRSSSKDLCFKSRIGGPRPEVSPMARQSRQPGRLQGDGGSEDWEEANTI